MLKNFLLSKRKVYYYSAFILLTIIIVISGTFYYRHTAAKAKSRAYDDIVSFANWKIKEIVRWKDEKHSEAEFLRENNHFAEIISDYLNSRNTNIYNAELLAWLRSLFKNSDYYDAVLIRNENSYISFFKNDSLGERDFKFFHQCANRNKIILTNFRKNFHNNVMLDFFIPVSFTDQKPFAVLMLRIDPSIFLYPIIKTKPALSQTGESYIFQKDKDSILILSELHNMKSAALNHKISIKNHLLSSIRGSAAQSGVKEGVDYRGVKVLADIEDIPKTPWLIVSKIDIEEVYQPVREQTWYIVIVFLLLILVSGVVIFILWKNERIKYYNQRLKLEQERNILREKLEYLVQYANDIIVVMDEEGKIQQANEKAVKVYGYQPEELITLNINDLRIPEYRKENDELISSIKEKGGLIYESFHQKKNGESFPVEVSAKVIDIGDRENLQLIIRDISERKKSEELLRISAERFQEIFNVNIIGICLSDRKGNLVDANNYYLNLIGYTREDFQKMNMNWKQLTPEQFLALDYQALEQINTLDCSIPYEKQYITKYGSEVWVQISLAKLPGSDYLIAFVQDVSARKDSEAALKRSEEKFIKLFSDSPVAMGLFDISRFKTIDINNAFEKLYGYTKEEIVGNNPIKEVYAVKRQRDILTISTLKNKPVEDFELTVKTKSGKYKQVSITNVFLEIDNRKCLFSVSYDITARKKAEQDLKKSEEKFQILFKDSPVSMVLMDLKTQTTVDVNKAFEKLYGYTREEVIGKPPPELFIDQEQLKYIVAHTVSKDPLYDFEVHIRTKSGEEKIFSVSTEYLDVNDRECVLTVAYDITEKKLVEESIRESEAQLKQMAEAIPHLIFSALPDGTITYINNRFGEYSGINTQLFYKWSWEDIVHPEDQPELETKWKQAFTIKDAFEMTLRLRKHNGTYEWHLSRVVPIKDASGQIEKWFGSSTNINQQTKAYDEVQKLLKELERSNKELEQFAYVASHDLQEPLRMIKSYIQLIELKQEIQLNENTKEYIGFITEGASRMQELINDLLKFSRITSKKPEFELFDCNIIVNEVLSDLKFKIKDENATIRVESLPMLKADRVQLRQLFQNFIQNALKFRGKDDPEIKISVQDKDDHWLFAVKDNGIGIEEKNYGRIFEIFQRLHEREKYPGTGIGLSICKKIVERHGGQICLDSVPGQGTTFFFTIPYS